MSAIEEEPSGPPEPVKVLITMHDKMDLLDFAGPLEAFSTAKHDPKDPESVAFKVIFAGPTEHVVTTQGASLRAHMDYNDAMKQLASVDILVIPGGGSDGVLTAKSQPLTIIKAFTELQKKNPSRERTLMSVCTGSLFLAEAGVLAGLSATTHPDYLAKFENICSNVAQRDMADRTDVVEERFVVNNLRFELGQDEESNPYIRRKSDATFGRRPSTARKGSMSFKASNSRRESILKRMNLRLGGLRVLTTSGVSSGIDGALYLVGAYVSDKSAEEVARVMCYDWKKGMVVDGTDV